jgi:hypothetical protein
MLSMIDFFTEVRAIFARPFEISSIANVLLGRQDDMGSVLAICHRRNFMKATIRRVLSLGSLLMLFSSFAHAVTPLVEASRAINPAMDAHGIYVKSEDDGAEGSRRCSISLVDGFERLALFKVTLSIENQNTAYVEAWGREMIDKHDGSEPQLGIYFPVNDVTVGALFNVPTMPSDGNIVQVSETRGVRYKTSMHGALNAMQQLRAMHPVTVVIRFDGNQTAQSDVKIELISPEDRQFFEECFERVERTATAANSVKTGG